MPVGSKFAEQVSECVPFHFLRSIVEIAEQMFFPCKCEYPPVDLNRSRVRTLNPFFLRVVLCLGSVASS